MSRAYRIRVKESLQRSLKAADEICTDLELLEILPPEQMADLLRNELKKRGFKEAGDTLTRQDGDVTVSIDPCNGEVSIKAEAAEQVDLEAAGTDTSYDDVGPSAEGVKKRLSDKLKQDLEAKAKQHEDRLQSRATEKLEQHLKDMEQELGQVVNTVTREALKQKAAQIGQIKELTEDPESGSLTIKVEV
jgi:hypothetical protein